MKHALGLIILSVLWSGGALCAPMAPQDPIGFFSGLREDNTKRLMEIDASIDKKLVQANTVDSVSHFETDIQDLQKQKSEHQLRQDFLNRMILKFDAKFRGGDLQSFLSVTLKEMAMVAAKAEDSSQVLYKFLNYMSVSISSLPQGQMDVLKFIEGYMNMGGVKEPMDPAQFLSHLDYYNGVQAQKANGISAEDAAQAVDATPVTTAPL